MASSMFLFVTFVEAALVGINLFLFSYGYPETVRNSLWEEGGLKLFNSNPRLRIYFYANHLEPPEIPYIWSQKLVILPIQQDKQSDRVLGSPTSILLLRSSLFAYLLHGLAYDLWACSTSG